MALTATVQKLLYEKRAVKKSPPFLTTQTLLAMKFIAIFLTVACIHVHANGYTQNITISVRNESLEKLIAGLKQQSGYEFFYNENLLKNAKPVTLSVKDMPIEQVLERCFKDQPLLTYTIIAKTVVIKDKPQPLNENTTNDATLNLVEGPPPPIDISGRITNAQGEPLAGASVIIKRTGKGDIANANGNFSLKGLNTDDVIVVSYTGYKEQSIRVGDRQNFTIVMVEAVDELDRMVIQAYGKTTQRLATGNIAKVTSEEIERQPVMNPLLALQGKVTGLDITQTSGFASAPIKVELRGRNTITNFPADPLYIIDGVPLTITDVGGQSSYARGSIGFLQSGFIGPANGQSLLFNINPSDIASIEVLKDADATAIYGSRGANGVILITTKHGNAGKTKFDLHIQEGVTRVTRFWNMLNTSQYRQMRREAFENNNIDYKDPINFPQAYDLVLWDTTHYTDWQKAIWGGTGNTIDVQTSLSGGDAHTNFRLGVGYNNTKSIMTVEGGDKRASSLLTVTHHSLDNRLNVSTEVLYTYAQSDMVDLPGDVTYAPNAPAIYDSIGHLNWAGWGGDINFMGSRNAYPFANLAKPYSSKTNFLNSHIDLSYQIIKNLTIKSSVGYSYGQANQQQFSPISSQDPLLNPKGSSVWAYNFNKNWIAEPQILYSAIIGKGKLDFLLGATLQQTKTEGLQVSGRDYTSDDLIQDISAAPTVVTHDNYGEYKYGAVFGRVGYSLDNKYIVNITGRRDGSSRFGPGKQFGSFVSVGAAWIFTQEPWMKKNLEVVSFGKLRVSYGTTGSDAVGDYKYLSRYSSNGTFPYNGSAVLVPTQAPNPQYQWQVNKKLEAAINLGLINDRVSIEIDYYNNRCNNQLVDFPLPVFTGFATTTANSPALVQNTGWELSSTVKVLSNKTFKWDITFNSTINKNRLVSYPNFDQSPYFTQLVIGRPLNILKLLHFTGIDPQTGQYTYYDVTKNSQVDIDYSGKTIDDRFIYDLSPKFFGGIGANLSYKSFQLSLFFNIKKQMGPNALLRSGYPGTLNTNQSANVLNRWQRPGDITNTARFTTQPMSSDIYFSASDGIYTDASFIRLSNFSAAFLLPASYIKKVGMKSCSIFFHTNNLFVITSYKGIDPETQNFGGMPPAKSIVAGINFNF